MKYTALLFFIILISCKGENAKKKTQHKYTNALIKETSPYLLQHAHNPVDWHAWNDATLEKAKTENKLVLISVGYSSCHWCHVMEHESFEDSLVAQVMNTNYINIKVDREERPDVDQVYINAVQLMKGSAGWPLNVVALPDGRPIWGDTYLPKEQWVTVLNQISKLYKENPNALIEQAENIQNGINSIAIVAVNNDAPVFEKQFIENAVNNWSKTFDNTFGGTTGAPKFMMPNNYHFLLRYAYQTNNSTLLDFVNLTLKKMAYGGIYDHIAGGFSRYSTDGKWHIPHFEKMLYDNGQLMSLYSKAYQVTKSPLYKDVVEQSLAFIEREMSSPGGGFYSSLDADTEGEEGKFYVWTQEVADKLKLSLEEVNTSLARSKATLMIERDKRVRPGLDDKVLTSWNALMLNGYIDAYRAFGNQAYLDRALKNANFLANTMMQKDYRLNRNYKSGKSVINAFLDDYALLIDAFTNMYQITFDEQWLNKAKGLTDYTLAHFKDEESGMMHYASDLDPDLIARKMELADNVIPSSNSSFARAIYKLGIFTYEDSYVQIAEQMMRNMVEEISATDIPNFYSNWCLLYSEMNLRPYEVAIVGDDYQSKLSALQKRYVPNALYLGGKDEGDLELLQDKLQEGETMIYVCQNRVCKLPVMEVEKAFDLMKN